MRTRRGGLTITFLTALLCATALSASSQSSLPVSAAATVTPSTPVEAKVEPLDTWLDRAEKVFRLLAYVIGAGWVYFNFFKGRTYRSRLEPRLSGSLARINGQAVLNVTLELKNVGLSKVTLKQEGTGLRFSILDLSSADDDWQHLSTIPILEDHGWIEPGEHLQENHLQRLPRPDVAVKAELHLTGETTAWYASTIVTAAVKEGEGHG